MSFRECIANGENEGKLTADQAARAGGLFDELEAQYAQRMTPSEASAQAARDTFDSLKKEAIEKRRVRLLQIRNWKEITACFRDQGLGCVTISDSRSSLPLLKEM